MLPALLDIPDHVADPRLPASPQDSGAGPATARSRQWFRRAFAWRTDFSFSRADLFVLLLFTAILAFAVACHERWSDEAQAWLLARDTSFSELFLHRLHYEGTPAAWHLLLHLFFKAGGTWAGLNWFAALFAVAGTYVLLRWSPFPAAIRYLLPFTFYLQYQYAAVARSYVLFPLLVWMVSALFGAKPRRPVLFAFAAGCLANLSLQGTVASICFAGLYFWETGKDRRRGLIPCAGILVCAWALAIYPALPAADIGFAVSDKIDGSTVHRLLSRSFGELPATPPQFRPATLPAPASIMAGEPLAPPDLVAQPSWRTDPGSRIVWNMDSRGHRLPEIPRLVLENLIAFLSETTWAISNSNLHACLLLALAVWWARSRRRLRMLLPYAAVLVFGTVIWVADHHTGLALVVLFGGLWIIGQDAGTRDSHAPSVERAFLICLFSVLLLQAGWSASSIVRDRFRSYDPGPETARYLKQLPPGTTMAAFGYWTTSIQPWFAANPFFNLRASYWAWSTHVDPNAHDLETLARHPGVVVYSWETTGTSPMRNQWVPQSREYALHDLVFDDLTAAGYRVTHTFCGQRFARFGTSYRDCNLILE